MWQEIMKNNDLDYFALRDGRYDQIVHLVGIKCMPACDNALSLGNSC